MSDPYIQCWKILVSVPYHLLVWSEGVVSGSGMSANGTASSLPTEKKKILSYLFTAIEL